MPSPEEVREALRVLPIPKEKRKRIEARINELTNLIGKLQPLGYLLSEEAQEEATRIVEYMKERDAAFRGRSMARSLLTNAYIPLLGVATVGYMMYEDRLLGFDKGYLEQLLTKSSGLELIAFILLFSVAQIWRRGTDARSKWNIDSKVILALSEFLDEGQKET